MASQRFNEEFFLRIPLKAFGGDGKFGKWKLLIFTELNSCICERDSSKASSVIATNESVEDSFLEDLYEPSNSNNLQDYRKKWQLYKLTIQYLPSNYIELFQQFTQIPFAWML